MTLNNCVVKDNTGGKGASVCNRGTLVINDSDISGNSGPAFVRNDTRYWGYGGGLLNEDNAILNRVSLSKNNAEKG